MASVPLTTTTTPLTETKDTSDALAISKITKLFKCTPDRIHQHNKDTTEHVKKSLCDPQLATLFDYLTKLDNVTINNYCEFGADKAGVRDIGRFLQALGVTVEHVTNVMIDTNRKLAESKSVRSSRYHIVTPDRKLVFTFTSTNGNQGYFHYLGVTGEASVVYKFILLFDEMGYSDDMCFGGRDFV